MYDQRGQGRSKETTEENYSYKIYADDIKALIDFYGLSNPILIGHSHGGPISIAFDQQYPNVAKQIVLVSAPIDFWGAMQAIFENCARRYVNEGNEEKLREISFINMKLAHEYDELTNEQKVFFVGAAFGHGLSFCKLYSTSNPTADEKALRKLIKDNPITEPISGGTTAMPGFIKNEDYVHKNFLEHVFTQRARYCGIYGDEDGLFTPLTLGVIRSTLYLPDEPKRFSIIRGASHGLYLDQQDRFLSALRDTCGLPLREIKQ